MRAEHLRVLNIARYSLHLRAMEAVNLPLFLGSTLRGAFGHALKQSVCIMRPRHCEQCLIADQCIYPYLFETSFTEAITRHKGNQQAPHPFILSPPIFFPAALGTREKSINPPGRVNVRAPHERSTRARPSERVVPALSFRHYLAEGDELTFGLILIGRAVHYLPYILYTVSSMAQQGLGVGRARFELSRASAVGSDGTVREIYNCETQRIVSESTCDNLGELVNTRLARLRDDGTLKLRFLTPTRIRVDGAPQSNPGFELLARNLFRRILLLTALHGQKQLEFDSRQLMDDASKVATESNDLWWWDLERYSNRQKTKIKIGGFVGEIAFRGERLNDFLPLVAAGELLHIGAGTSFGLGRYQIVT